MSVIPKVVDERFLAYRLRSTSLAGMVTAALAMVLFAVRFYGRGVWDWEALGFGLTFVAIKMTVMAWSYLRA